MSVQLFEFIISNSVNFLHQIFFHYEWLSRCSSTLSLPRVTKKYFLLTTSIQHQTDKKREYEMISIRGLSFVSTINYQNQTYKYFLADSIITKEILGVNGSRVWEVELKKQGDGMCIISMIKVTFDRHDFNP